MFITTCYVISCDVVDLDFLHKMDEDVERKCMACVKCEKQLAHVKFETKCGFFLHVILNEEIR